MKENINLCCKCRYHKSDIFGCDHFCTKNGGSTDVVTGERFYTKCYLMRNNNNSTCTFYERGGIVGLLAKCKHGVFKSKITR